MSTLFRASLGRNICLATRRYSTTPGGTPEVKPNWGLWAGVAGVAGIGAYVWSTYGQQGAVKGKAVQTKSPLESEFFKPFTLKKIEPYNHNTSKFIFEIPYGEASWLPVASCVVVKSTDPEALKDSKGKPVIRPYTPVSSPDLPGELHFLIKKYDSGNASKHIHELKVGETLQIKGPIPKFPYKANEFDEVALIGGGSGITPLYQILTRALPDKENKTKFKLIFANVTEKDILLREEFDGLKAKYPDTFDVVYVLDKPEKSWKGPSGFISKKLIQEHVAPASLGEKVKVFICGPPGQVKAISGAKDGMKQGEVDGVLKELGYSSDQVYKF